MLVWLLFGTYLWAALSFAALVWTVVISEFHLSFGDTLLVFLASLFWPLFIFIILAILLFDRG